MYNDCLGNIAFGVQLVKCWYGVESGIFSNGN